MKKLCLLSFLLFLVPLYLSAQEHHLSSHQKNVHQNTLHQDFKPFRVAVIMGHTSIPPGNCSERMFIPSWGLDLEYWFNHKWGIGSHNDIEVEAYVVEVGQEQVTGGDPHNVPIDEVNPAPADNSHPTYIEREYPLVTTLEVLWKPWKGLVLQIGPGYEVEKEKNYAVIRWGVEYEFELPGHWDIFPTFFYDSRIDAFDTCSIGIGVGKRF